MVSILSLPQCVNSTSGFTYLATERLVGMWNNIYRADSKLAPSQWETSLQSNAVSYWLGTNWELALIYVKYSPPIHFRYINGLVQHCNNYISNALKINTLEVLQSGTKPSISYIYFLILERCYGRLVKHRISGPCPRLHMKINGH